MHQPFMALRWRFGNPSVNLREKGLFPEETPYFPSRNSESTEQKHYFSKQGILLVDGMDEGFCAIVLN